MAAQEWKSSAFTVTNDLILINNQCSKTGSGYWQQRHTEKRLQINETIETSRAVTEL
jgi:hypothetical protein